MAKLQILGGILISTALLLSSVGAALADGDATPTPELINGTEAVANDEEDVDAEYQGLVGTVGEESDIEGGNIKLGTKAHGEVDVILSEETIYKVPGQKDAGKDDVVKGSRVAILATESDDGQYTAVRVMVIPGKATRRHVTGVVVSVEDKTMTITNAKGETLTIDIPEGVRGGVVGDFISAAVRQSPDKERSVAIGAQTAEQVRERIQAHLDEVAARKAERVAEKEQKRKAIERLSNQLEHLGKKHKEVLRNALEKADDERAREAIQQAIATSEHRLQKAQEVTRRARGMNE